MIHPYKARFPNVREIFVPDPGYILCASDLDRADLQVVAWDSGCTLLKQLLKEGLDVHLYNAGHAYNLDISLDRLRDPAEVDLLSVQYKRERNLAKAGGHATNYLVHAATLATHLGVTEPEAQAFIDNHFARYPEIRDWHKRVWHEILTEQCTRNAFGFVSRYFDRITEKTLGEAVAWIPQSTVGLIINKAWERMDHLVPAAEVLLQVHDELIYQVPEDSLAELKPALKESFQVVVPYEDPLIIPAGLKTSSRSWAHVKSTSWD
jgi:DNA polymerase-1